MDGAWDLGRTAGAKDVNPEPRRTQARALLYSGVVNTAETGNEPAAQPGGTPEADSAESGTAEIRTWWQRSAPLAAGAALAIGAATLWFGNMLSRVPLDQHATFGYLLMLPLLLIVPAFSLAGLRLSWAAYGNNTADARTLVVVVALTAVVCNLLAMFRFGAALLRIFSN
jgi:cation transport ATPase